MGTLGPYHSSEHMQVVGSGCFFESLYRTYSSQVLQAITMDTRSVHVHIS